MSTPKEPAPVEPTPTAGQQTQRRWFPWLVFFVTVALMLCLLGFFVYFVLTGRAQEVFRPLHLFAVIPSPKPAAGF